MTKERNLLSFDIECSVVDISRIYLNLMIQKKNEYSPSQTYMRLFRSIANYKLAMMIAVVGILITSASEAAIYKFVAPPLFDKGVIAKNPEFLRQAPWYILAVFLIRGIGDFLSKYCMGYVGRNTVKDHRALLLTQLLFVPIAFFDHCTTGELVSKVNYDTEQIATALSNAILDIFKGIATITFLLVVMLSINWQITLTVLIIVPIVGKYLKTISKRMRYYSSKVQNTMGIITHVASEIINGHKEIRAFQGKDVEQERIKTVTIANCYQEIKVVLIIACSEPIMQFICAFVLATLVYLATMNNIHITPGEFIGLFGAVFGLIRPIKQITQVNNILQRGISAAYSIYQLLDEPKEQDTGSKRLIRATGNLIFKQVCFTYSNRNLKKTDIRIEKATLKNITFEVMPGETVALVGCSGGGKSTLVSLLPRFYEFQKGHILLDGIDIRDITLDSLREQIAIVTQQVVLFNDTIANNITYGLKRHMPYEEIVEAATAAHAMDFIQKLPDGLNTYVGQNGVLLSGGQRQRLAISRAILKDASILILDEATSSLDSESEQHIQAALENVMMQRTTLVIAHRLSTIEKANKILVLENGQVTECGTHQELMCKQDSRYQQLQRSQFENIAEA